ncbi:hypothetical protein [Streptomyces violaceusniger]|uniref:hypothetical protein n=1 Tax=Streptomyces violaceusniger TaxID=68280 RepID=UPI0038071AFF
MSHPQDPHRPQVAVPPAPLLDPLSAPLTGPVELWAERQTAEPVVWVPDAYGRMVPMPKSLAPPAVLPTEPRDLSPQPVLDPRAQRIAAAGVGTGAAAAGVGWGLGQAAAGVSSGSLLFVLALLLAWRASGPRGGDTYITHAHTTSRWWGKATTKIENR